MRYAAPGGLRSLVGVRPTGCRSRTRSASTSDHDAIVLAMPDPQAARLAPDAVDWVDYEPVIAVVAGWPLACWPIADAAFVNDDADLTLIADDGSRRGDGAAVLVAAHDGGRGPARIWTTRTTRWRRCSAALRRVLGVSDDPEWTHAHRWTFAKPTGTHGDDAFGLITSGARRSGCAATRGALGCAADRIGLDVRASPGDGDRWPSRVGRVSELAGRAHRATDSLHSMIYFAPEAEEQLVAAGLRPGRMPYFASRSAPMGAVTRPASRRRRS